MDDTGLSKEQLDMMLEYELEIKVGYAMFWLPDTVLDKRYPYGYNEEKAKQIDRVCRVLRQQGVTSDEEGALFDPVCKKEKQDAFFRVVKDPTNPNSAIFVDSNGRIFESMQALFRDHHTTNCIPATGQQNEDGQIIVETEGSQATKQLREVVGGVRKGLGVASDFMDVLVIIPRIQRVLAPISSMNLYVTILSGLIDIATDVYNFVKHGEKSGRELCLETLRNLSGVLPTLFSKYVGGKAGKGLIVGKKVRFATTALNICSLSLDGLELMSKIYSLAKKVDEHGWRSLKPLEVYQIVASTFFYTNTILSPETSFKIIGEAQDDSLQQFRKGLGNSKAQNGFDYLLRCIPNEGKMFAKARTIRGLKNIDEPVKFFSNLDDNKKGKVHLDEDGKLNFE